MVCYLYAKRSTKIYHVCRYLQGKPIPIKKRNELIIMESFLTEQINHAVQAGVDCFLMNCTYCDFYILALMIFNKLLQEIELKCIFVDYHPIYEYMDKSLLSIFRFIFDKSKFHILNLSENKENICFDNADMIIGYLSPLIESHSTIVLNASHKGIPYINLYPVIKNNKKPAGESQSVKSLG